MGIEYCEKTYEMNDVYDILEFAFLRRYLNPNDSFLIKIQALSILQIHFESEIEKLNKKYSERNGKKERWPDDIFVKYEQDDKKIRIKHAETFSKITTETLENLSNQKHIGTYIKYINVFFAEEKSQFEKMIEP